VYKWIHRVWYENAPSYVLLLPLSGIYWLVISLRRLCYKLGLFRTQILPVPVLVVGNITAGGTGKTPITIWLTRELRRRGFSPGIVSRGYGGSKSPASMRVDKDSDPAVVGDEPVLLAQRAGCPVVVDADRCRAATMLAEDGVDLVIADDGLQHYRMPRSYEICVIDGARGLGNRLLFPAGPLRESIGRLNNVDQVLLNGHLREDHDELSVVEQNAMVFELAATEACRLNGSLTRPIDRFSGTTVHAVAAIGNPNRYFDMLRSHGIQVIEHAFRDHAKIERNDLKFGDDFDILMTEKDAVKLGDSMSDKYWYVPVDVQMDKVIVGPWLEQIESRMRAEQGACQ
jgi:tetraacyldisaccharide 4'-kinase